MKIYILTDNDYEGCFYNGAVSGPDTLDLKEERKKHREAWDKYTHIKPRTPESPYTDYTPHEKGIKPPFSFIDWLLENCDCKDAAEEGLVIEEEHDYTS